MVGDLDGATSLQIILAQARRLHEVALQAELERLRGMEGDGNAGAFAGLAVDLVAAFDAQ